MTVATRWHPPLVSAFVPVGVDLEATATSRTALRCARWPSVVGDAARTEQRDPADEAGSCKQPKEGLANLPIEKIEDVVKPTDAQEADLNALQDATTKAVSIMQAACPDEPPLTPTGRLEAMQTRLQAMIDAAITVKPSLDSFYASLSSEQKARFNRIGQELAQSGG